MICFPINCNHEKKFFSILLRERPYYTRNVAKSEIFNVAKTNYLNITKSKVFNVAKTELSHVAETKLFNVTKSESYNVAETELSVVA